MKRNIGHSRREFIKRGALFVPAIFVPKLIRASSPQHLNAAFFRAKVASGGGGGSCTPAYTDVSSGGYGTGNRTSVLSIFTVNFGTTGTLTILINGSHTDQVFFFNNNTLNGSNAIQFQFPVAVIIKEIKFWQSASAATHGTWKAQASSTATLNTTIVDAAWTDISSSFTLGGVNGANTITAVSGNTTGGTQLQLRGLSGSSSNAPWANEFEFSYCLA